MNNVVFTLNNKQFHTTIYGNCSFYLWTRGEISDSFVNKVARIAVDGYMDMNHLSGKPTNIQWRF